MKIPIKLQEQLLGLRAKLPKDRQDRFAQALGQRVSEAADSNIFSYSVIGAAMGAVMEVIPGIETITGIDDWVEVGMALGAWVGYSKDQKEREQRKRIKAIIEEEVRNALA